MIVKTIPKCIKVSIGAALGLLIAQLGMKNADGWLPKVLWLSAI